MKNYQVTLTLDDLPDDTDEALETITDALLDGIKIPPHKLAIHCDCTPASEINPEDLYKKFFAHSKNLSEKEFPDSKDLLHYIVTVLAENYSQECYTGKQLQDIILILWKQLEHRKLLPL